MRQLAATIPAATPAMRERKPRGSRIAILGYGFRPFFLGAAVWALLALPVWLAAYAGLGWPAAAEARGFGALDWHRHAMLFGFVPAAIAGFLLTAVPNWVGRAGYAGAPLGFLAALWLAGRILLLPGMPVPHALAALVDAAFLPALGAMLAPSLIRARLWRNMPFLLFLALLACANAAIHLDALALAPAGAAGPAYRLAFGVVSLMVAVIGGRIVPAFTLNGLRRLGRPVELQPAPRLNQAAIAALVAAVAADVIAPEHIGAGLLAALAALLHAARLSRWHGLKTLPNPLLWVLHLGYAWLVAAFALRALHVLGGIGAAAVATHALAVGCFATMILGVMSRATLGHTGRALAAPRATAAAYMLVTLAAILRVGGVLLLPQFALEATLAAGLAWSAAFLLFLWDFAPILLRPRADGRPG